MKQPPRFTAKKLPRAHGPYRYGVYDNGVLVNSCFVTKDEARECAARRNANLTNQTAAKLP